MIFILICLLGTGILTGLLILFFEQSINSQSALVVAGVTTVLTAIASSIISVLTGPLSLLIIPLVVIPASAFYFSLSTGEEFKKCLVAGTAWTFTYIGINFGIGIIFSA